MARARKGPAGVTAAAVGRHLDLTRQRVGQLVTEGVFQRLPGGGFDLDACRLAYIRWIRDDARRAARSAAESGVQLARQREIEQRIAIRDHKLIDIDEHDAVFAEAFGLLKSELIGIPARVSREPTVRAKIEAEIDAALNRCSARFADMSNELKATGKAPTRPSKRD